MSKTGGKKIDMSGRKAKTVFEAISRYGHDMDFEPCHKPTAKQTNDMKSRVAILKRRAENGEELFHTDDVILKEGNL